MPAVVFQVIDSSQDPEVYIIPTQVTIYNGSDEFVSSFIVDTEEGYSELLGVGSYYAVLSKSGRVFYENLVSVEVAEDTTGVVLEGEGKDVIPPIPSDDLLLAYVKIVDMSGQPREDVRVFIGTESFPPRVTETYTVMPSGSIVMTTDTDGYASVLLVKGSKIKVSVEGSTFYREFTLPNETGSTVINLMESASDAPDPFLPRREVPSPFEVS